VCQTVKIFVLLRNAITWLWISEDAAEGDSSSRPDGNDGLPTSSADGFCGMQTNQVDDGRSGWCRQNKVHSILLVLFL